MHLLAYVSRTEIWKKRRKFDILFLLGFYWGKKCLFQFLHKSKNTVNRLWDEVTISAEMLPDVRVLGLVTTLFIVLVHFSQETANEQNAAIGLTFYKQTFNFLSCSVHISEVLSAMIAQKTSSLCTETWEQRALKRLQSFFQKPEFVLFLHNQSLWTRGSTVSYDWYFIWSFPFKILKFFHSSRDPNCPLTVTWKQ